MPSSDDVKVKRIGNIVDQLVSSAWVKLTRSMDGTDAIVGHLSSIGESCSEGTGCSIIVTIIHRCCKVAGDKYKGQQYN